MMANERNKPSVIAQLMGLDDAPRQLQPVYRQQRVLSENYMRNSASIGSWRRRSSKLKQESQPKNKGTSKSNDSFDGIKRGNEERNSVNVTFGWEFKKQLLERLKRTKISQEIWSNKRACNRGETPKLVDPELKETLQVVISGNEGWKDKSVTKLPIFKRVNLSSSSNKKFKRMSPGDLRSSIGRHDKNVPTDFEDVGISCSLDISVDRESPCEDGFTSLNCVNIDNELSNSSGEAYQPSPNSVLEPDNSSSSDYGDDVSSDLHGLWIKLQILKSESEENESKSEMVTLNDENANEKTTSLYVRQKNKPISCFGPKESQQFIYLVDVLNELGSQGNKMEVCFEKCMMNPMIFEKLEKKYNKQKSWNRVDRRLLFDRINLGLTEIVRSKPLWRKMSTFLRRDIIEEELWNMLLGQENKVNSNFSEKSIGKEPWLELGDEVDSIVEEIEAFLFNEFVTELVSI